MILVCFKGEWGVQALIFLWWLQFNFKHLLFPHFKNVQYLFFFFELCLEICDYLNKMFDTLRPDDTKVDVVSTGRWRVWAGQTTPRLMVPSFFIQNQRSSEVLSDLRLNSLWLVIIWSHDASVCHWKIKEILNCFKGVAKWWKQMGPRRKTLNRFTAWILIDVLILAGREEDVENALKQFHLFGKYERSWPMKVFCSGIISRRIEAPLLHEICHVTLICPHTVRQKQLNVWIGLQVPDRWY